MRLCISFIETVTLDTGKTTIYIIRLIINDLENIDNQIRALKRKAIELRNSAPKPIYDFNNEIHLKVRANRLKLATVKKVNTKSNKILKTKFMKGKATFDSKAVSTKRLLVATGYAGVEIVKSEIVSPKKTAHTLQFARLEDISEMGGYIATLSDEDITKELERRDKLKDAAEKAKK
jgi:hypothetical protein